MTLWSFVLQWLSRIGSLHGHCAHESASVTCEGFVPFFVVDVLILVLLLGAMVGCQSWAMVT